MTKEELKLQLNLLSDIIKNHFASQSQVKILEAGCGSATHIPLPEEYIVTGIDISQKQLERNTNLSEKILGDIQTYPFEPNSFDMVISWYVLEHLKYPKKAIQNFKNAIKPNGLIVLAIPNIWSVKGIITKLTPTFVHVWFYKHIFKRKAAGKDDVGPFKTFLKTSISPNNIREYACKNTLEVIHFAYIEEYFSSNLKKINPLAYTLQKLVGGLLWAFSLGKITQKNTEYALILKK